MRIYTGLYDPETLRTVAELGGQGILTNANTIYKFFGSEKTLDEITQWMLDNSFGMPVFPSIHGKDTRSIVEVGRRLHALDPQRVGVKILSNTQGFSAMRVLSAEGVRCVATGMFTYTQALIAAYSGAYAISPFVGRGSAAGLDMYEMIRLTKEKYKELENPPEILAASIHNLDEINRSFAAGADAVAASFDLLMQMVNCDLSRMTELSFGEAFAKIKGEDVSYLPLKGEDPHAYQE